MDTATLLMVGLAAVLFMVAFLRGRVHLQGLERAGNMVWSNVLLLASSFVVAGLVQVLIPGQTLQRWLGSESGFRGILLGCAAGALTPGSPYAVFPIVGSFHKAGAAVGPLVGFVSAWALWSVTRLPTEAALIGPRVTLIRYMATFAVPPLAGLFAQHVLARLI
jgi:uncharacterized membrane protein YraQ (UPF0718 family)